MILIKIFDEDKIFNCRDVKINTIKTCLINSDFFTF